MKLFGHSLLLAAGLATSAAHAVEPTAYQLGDGGAIAPHLALEFGTDSNPLRTDEGSEQSLFFRLQPSLTYLAQRRNNRLTIGYAGDFYQYVENFCQTQSELLRPGECVPGAEDFDNASYQDHELSLDGFAEITSRLRGTVDLNYEIENQPLGTGLSSNLGVLNALTETEYWQRAGARAELSYGASQARGEVVAGIRLQTRELNSERDVDLDAISDNSVAPYGRLLYRVGTRTQLFAGLGFDWVRDSISFDDNGEVDRNFERNISRFSFGAELGSDSVTSGSVSLSLVNEDFLESSLTAREDITFLGIDASLVWRPREFSTVRFNASRETGSGTLGDSLSLNTRFGATWVHFWRERFSTNTRLALNWDENIVEELTEVDNFDLSRGDTDTTVSFRFGGNYNIRRWLDVGGFINIDSRSGDGFERDFDRTVIGITANGTI